MLSRIAVIGRGNHYDSCVKWMSKNLIYYQKDRDILYFEEKYECVISNRILVNTELTLVFNKYGDFGKINAKYIWPIDLFNIHRDYNPNFFEKGNHTISDNHIEIDNNIYLPYSDSVDWYDFFKYIKVRGFN